MVSLMYHRIGEPDTNPWGVCVPPARFEEQINWITTRYAVVDPATLLAQLKNHSVEKNAVLITFDDGYRDNYLVAKPILEQYGCPATFFIPTGFIDAGSAYWWDELEVIFLHSAVLPPELTLTIAGKPERFTLSTLALNKEEMVRIRHWRWYQEPPADRCAVFLAVWTLLRPLPLAEIERQMADIRKWGETAGPFPYCRLPMTGSDLLQLSENPLFTIGMHSHTHPDLAAQSEEVQSMELEQCQRELKTRFQTDSRILAYPYGLYNESTLNQVKRLKFDLCFTTSAVMIDSDSSRFELGRFQAQDQSIEEFKRLFTGLPDSAI